MHISIPWVLIMLADSWDPFQTYWIRVSRDLAGKYTLRVHSPGASDPSGLNKCLLVSCVPDATQGPDLKVDSTASGMQNGRDPLEDHWAVAYKTKAYSYRKIQESHTPGTYPKEMKT